MTPPVLLQVTDTHLFADPNGELHEMNTLNSLNRVLDFICRKEGQIDCLIATGDIAQDSSLNAYKNFMLAIRKLKVSCFWIPGNHDSGRLMRRASTGTNYCQKQYTVANWQIVLLDTSVKQEVYGFLKEEELKFLEETLYLSNNNVTIQHVIIFLHHNPTKTYDTWSRDIGLRDHSRFFKILKKYPKVRSVTFGHLHQELDFLQDGIRLLCTPSTCVQFASNTAEFAIDSRSPGYRRLKLCEDGCIDTKVIRLNSDHELEQDYEQSMRS